MQNAELLKIRYKSNAKEFRQQLAAEWRETEELYRKNGTGVMGNCQMLERLSFLAGEDWRKNGKRYSDRQRVFSFYYHPKHSDPVRVEYFLSRFSNVVLLPPKRCHSIRSAMGIRNNSAKSYEPTGNVLLIKRFLDSQQTADQRFFTCNEIIMKVLGAAELDITPSQQASVGKVMARLGWEKRREATGKRRWFYVRPS